MFLVLILDAASRIGDLNAELALFTQTAQIDHNSAILRSELKGIGEQVHDNLIEIGLINIGPQFVLGMIIEELDILLVGR